MTYKKKTNRLTYPIGLFSLTLIFLLAVGCDENTPTAANTGRLQVAFSGPTDYETLKVEIYSNSVCEGEPAATRVLNSDDAVALFENLQADTGHCVQAEAWDSDNAAIYFGKGYLYVDQKKDPQEEGPNLITVLLHQTATGLDTAPRIHAVALDGGGARLARDIDVRAIPDLYVIAPEPSEVIELSVQAKDIDGDTLEVQWAVKNGPSPTAEDVGEIIGQRGQNTIEWRHEQEGEYFVHVGVDDGRGGTSAFTFNVYVGTGAAGSIPEPQFNSFPTIAMDAVMGYGEEPDYSDTVIELRASFYDPDGDAVDTVGWTSECTSPMTTDPESPRAYLGPLMQEVCTVTFRVCDGLGCHSTNPRLDISCATVHPSLPIFPPPDYDPCDPSASLWGWPCYLIAVCCPTPEDNECVHNGWECGTGLDICGYDVSCGECPDAGVCQDHVCIPNGDL